ARAPASSRGTSCWCRQGTRPRPAPRRRRTARGAEPSEGYNHEPRSCYHSPGRFRDDLTMPYRRVASRVACLLGALIVIAAPLVARAVAAPADGGRPARLEVWDLKLGTSAAALPDGFVDYACGTNGGPPSTPLASFQDFWRCRPEPSGLREVYFRYDDELEYWAQANNLARAHRQ